MDFQSPGVCWRQVVFSICYHRPSKSYKSALSRKLETRWCSSPDPAWLCLQEARCAHAVSSRKWAPETSVWENLHFLLTAEGSFMFIPPGLETNWWVKAISIFLVFHGIWKGELNTSFGKTIMVSGSDLICSANEVPKKQRITICSGSQRDSMCFSTICLQRLQIFRHHWVSCCFSGHGVVAVMSPSVPLLSILHHSWSTNCLPKSHYPCHAHPFITSKIPHERHHQATQL